LGERTGEERFLSAAAEAIRYEHAVFLPEQGNWPDFRQPGPRAFEGLPCNWCHGAAGIGLGRLACSSLAIPELEQDLEAAMATTLARPPAGLDYLCCGNLGRLELLVTGAEFKSRADWQQLAGQRAAVLLKTAQSTGRWRFDPTLGGEVYNPGFFTGAAGIGYMLLRLADPERFPSVLTWQ
jgi:lantibiotic modifying enzyme